MKNFILIFAVILGLGFTSCQKEEIKPNNSVEMVDETIEIFGEWVLVDGKMYMENLETGEKTVYSHFDATQNVSSLRYGGYMYEFERIVQDSTTWTFVEPQYNSNMGEFWLDNDSIQPYGLYLTNSNMSIVENSTGPQQLGGSSRPLTAFIDEYGNQTVNFYVQEAYENINGVNYKYFSELTFQKQ